MSEMKINTLSVDLLQDNASISMFHLGVPKDGKNSVTSVSVQVPLESSVNQAEIDLRRHAITAAKRTLEEAIRTLDGYTL